MAPSWRDGLQRDPNWQNPEDQCAINTIQRLLDDNAAPDLAANEATSSYEIRLLAGKTDLWSLWKLICLAISHPLTTDRNLERLAETVVQITRSPDVVVHGKIVESNGRQYWHDLPEFSFWFMEYALSELDRFSSSILCTNTTCRCAYRREYR
jgi:hypothetical protein